MAEWKEGDPVAPPKSFLSPDLLLRYYDALNELVIVMEALDEELIENEGATTLTFSKSKLGSNIIKARNKNRARIEMMGWDKDE